MPTQASLSGKVALITGGNSGIGAATARLFAKEGARVVIAARNTEKGERIADEIKRTGGDVRFVACDVRQMADCETAVRATLDAYGRVDILFNNAGVVPFATLLDTNETDWLNTFDINVHGTYRMCKAVLPNMLAQGSGVIINNASDWAVTGGQGAAAYCSTKGAVAQLTRCLALDYGRQGIRANAICPGDTVVERWRDRWQSQHGETFEEALAKIGADFPLGRVGHPDEIAQAVLFLAGDNSAYMTGQMLIVDGGNTAGGVSTKY